MTKTKPFMYTCYWDPSATEVPPCCEAATKKITFSTTSVVLLLNVPLPCPEEQYLGGNQIPERGTKPKITGILFVCNEPGRSLLYRAHVTINGSAPNGGVRATMRKYNKFLVNKTRKVNRCKSRALWRVVWSLSYGSCECVGLHI